MNPSMITATSSSSSSSSPPSACYAFVPPPSASTSGGLLLARNRQPADEARSGMAEVRRYSAGERRERIERYRSKRERRNFHKKITYACRKTLAENRRRIKGRFAHTGGDDEYRKPQLLPTEAEADQAAGSQIPSSKLGKVDVDGGSGSGSSSGSAVPEWWPAMEEALAREEDIHLLDEEIMLASYLGVNLY